MRKPRGSSVAVSVRIMTKSGDLESSHCALLIEHTIKA